MEIDVEAFRSEKMSARHILDGMPHGSDKKDYSDYIVRLEQLTKKLLKARYDRITIYTNVLDIIELIPDETEKELLTYRYLKGYTWEKISDMMQYSYAQVHRIHSKAIERLSGMKNVIEAIDLAEPEEVES